MDKRWDFRLTLARAAVFGPLLVGLACFLYFVTNNRYYAPLEIKVSGASTTSGTLEIFWLSGEEPNNEILPHQKTTVTIPGSQKTTPTTETVPSTPAARFEQTASLPQSLIKEIRLNWTGTEEFTLERLEIFVDKTPHASAERLRLRPNKLKNLPATLTINNARFHLGLTILQGVLAAILAWFAALAFSLPRRFKTDSLSSTLRALFMQEHRPVFWLTFGILTGAYCLWLLAYWPAAMTNDSWMTLAEMRSLILTDWHPYVYTIYALALFQFGETIAAISLFQILVTALIIASALFLAYRNKVNSGIIVCFVVFFAISAPIGMYNITLWKDIPFSVAVTALSLGLYFLRLRQQQNQPEFTFPKWSLPFIAALLVLLCASRHNGIIFYPLLPLLCFRILSRRQLCYLIGFLFTTFLTLNYGIPRYFAIKKTSGSPQQQLRTAFAIMTHPGYFSHDHGKDRRIVEQAIGYSFDRVESEFPRRWFDLFDASDVQKNQFLPSGGETEEYNKEFITELMVNNIPILMGSRTYEFFHSLGIHQNKWGDSIRRYQNPSQLHGSNLTPPGNTIFGASHTASNPFPALHNLLERYSEWTKHFDGFFSSQVLVWNLLVPLGVMVAVIFFFSGLSAPGLFCLPSLITAGGVFIAGAGESWRYFYCIYLCGYLAIPLTIAYFKAVVKR